jgi:RNA polymerase sigma-70 factor (ECF subfamily)
MKKSILTTDLVARFRQGDHEAYEIIFNAYYGMFCVFVSKMVGDQYLAEDLVEDVFVKLWEKHAELDLNDAYLNTMVINRCLDHIRRRRVVRKAVKELMYTTKQEEDSIQSIRRFLVEANLERYIHEAMPAMTPNVRDVFRLAYNRKLKTSEIAAIRNLSVKTVQLQLRIAVTILYACISKHL